MGAIEIGDKAKSVVINGIDILRGGKIILNPSHGGNQTTDEIRIANRVRVKASKMHASGYSGKHVAQFARRQVMSEAQKLKTGSFGKDDQCAKKCTKPDIATKGVNATPPKEPLPLPIHTEN